MTVTKFSGISISQVSATKHFTCDEMLLNVHFVANLQLRVKAKDFWKSLGQKPGDFLDFFPPTNGVRPGRIDKCDVDKKTKSEEFVEERRRSWAVVYVEAR